MDPAVAVVTRALTPGARATWIHTPRGGYGYTMRVDVIVVSVGPKRVRVEAPLERGGTKLVWVRPENLGPPHVRFCVCHSGSVCGPACATRHHDGCDHAEAVT